MHLAACLSLLGEIMSNYFEPLLLTAPPSMHSPCMPRHASPVDYLPCSLKDVFCYISLLSKRIVSIRNIGFRYVVRGFEDAASGLV